MSSVIENAKIAAPPKKQSPITLARRSAALWDKDAPHDRQLDVLGLQFANIPLKDASAELVQAAATGRQIRAVFVNAHVMNTVWSDPAYWRTVATAQRRFADGSGMAIAARMAGKTFVDNVNGTDMLPMLCDHALRTGQSIYLVGGIPEAAAGTLANLVSMGFGPALAGAHHGYFARGSEEEASVIAAINASKATIVLVGMGVPIQDLWIEANASRLKAPVLVGVGGLFDFFSGRATRAPKLLRTFGLEWTWRLMREPGRMWKRYIIGNFTFLARSAFEAWWPAKVRSERTA